MSSFINPHVSEVFFSSTKDDFYRNVHAALFQTDGDLYCQYTERTKHQSPHLVKSYNCSV